MNLKKCCAFLAAASLMVTSSVVVTGCGNKDTQVISAEDAENNVVFSVADLDVTQAEFNLFLIQYIYTGALAGTEIDKDTVLSEVVSEIQLEYVEYQLAQVTDGVVVQADELASYQQNADSFYNYFGEEFLSDYGITKDTVNALYEKQAYISAMTNKAMEDLESDYHDKYEEEYGDLTFHSFYFALFPSYQTDSDGEPVYTSEDTLISLSDDEMKQQQERAQEYYKRAVAGLESGEESETMENLSEEYGISAVSGMEHNYDGAYTTELNELIASLDEGEISPPFETDSGYVIVRMDVVNDTDYRDYAIDYLVSANASGMLSTLQENWISAAGVDSSDCDLTQFEDFDVQALSDRMGENGYSINN